MQTHHSPTHPQPATNGLRQYQATRFAFRARWFDDHIVHTITASRDPSSIPIRQVVLLGAGMDSRAWRLPHLQDVRWFELDRPGVLQAKLRMLQRVGAQGGDVYGEQGLVLEGMGAQGGETQGSWYGDLLVLFFGVVVFLVLLVLSCIRAEIACVSWDTQATTSLAPPNQHQHHTAHTAFPCSVPSGGG